MDINREDKVPLDKLQEYELVSISTALDFFKKPIEIMQWGIFEDIVKISDYISPSSKYYCVEHNNSIANEFKALMNDKLKELMTLECIETDEPYLEGISDGNYKQFKNYILYPAKIGNKFDFIIISGRAKTDCFKYSWNLLSSNGLTVIVDSPKSESISTIKKNAFTLTIANPDIRHKDNRLLFVSKNKDLLTNLHLKLSIILPKKTLIEQNFQNIVNLPINEEIPERYRQNKCLFIHTYPENLIEEYYSNPELESLTYAEQKEYIMSRYYGASDYYSYNLRNCGWLTDDIIVNCKQLQNAWAKEKISVSSGTGILIDQIKEIKPEVVFLLNASIISPELLKEIKRYTKIIAAKIDNETNLNPAIFALDIIFTSNKDYISKFRTKGIPTYELPYMFDIRLLNSAKSFAERKYNISYIYNENDNLEYIEKLTEKNEINIWCDFPGIDISKSIIKDKVISKATGQKIFDIYSNSKIVLYAGNLEKSGYKQMIEVAGCGALLISYYQKGLNEILEIGNECAVYRNSAEANAMIKFYLENLEDGESIAKKAQSKIIEQNSYLVNMELLSELLSRHIKYKALKNQSNKTKSDFISSAIERIEKIDINDELINAWKNPQIPELQRELVQGELEQMYKGNTPILFDVLVKLLNPILRKNSEVVEIGCSSGYYSEVIEYLAVKKIKYSGIDYSEAFINMAKEYYPKHNFILANAEDLPINENSAEIIISAGVLSHSLKYAEQISSLVKAASEHIIIHRLPICKNRATHYNKKKLYNTEILDIRFSADEINAIFKLYGLEIVKSIEYYTNEKDDEYELSLLLKKVISDENPV